MKRSLTVAFVTIIDIPEFSHFLFVDYTREVYRLDKRYGNNKVPRLSFLEFLDQDITQICKENNQFDAVYLLLYYYYGGCIYTALKEFGKALYFLEVAVTCPTAAVSHVMLEAYKKYLLVGLLVHGDKPKDSVMSLPKFTSPIVGKFLKPLCAAYSEIVRAYHVNAPEELRTVVTKYQVHVLCCQA